MDKKNEKYRKKTIRENTRMGKFSFFFFGLLTSTDDVSKLGLASAVQRSESRGRASVGQARGSKIKIK